MIELNIVSLVMCAAVLALAVPVIVFAVQIGVGVASLRKSKPGPVPRGPETRVAILVPAHNEGAGLRSTLSDARASLRDGDRLLVVADNCSDDTADEARQADAEVVERTDPERRGKGFALDYGVRTLAADPPDVIVVVDADCHLAEGAIDRLAGYAHETNRPAQALYLMTAPSQSEVSHQVAEFAWRVKNHLRPAGLAELGLPCQLMGTGMAFPWDAIQSSQLASTEIVEDMKLGLDLAAAGRAPLFCAAAHVSSKFPERASGARTQRQRWEGGHLSLIKTLVPGHLFEALRTRNRDLFALALDLAVPPLAFLVLCVGVVALVSAALAIAGIAQLPLWFAGAVVLILALSVAVAWSHVGRDVLPATALTKIPAYLASKLGIYAGVFRRRPRPEWVRTDRSSGS